MSIGKAHSGAGYRQTPVATRFQPGQSGNPRGRPKNAKGVKAELEAEFNEFVTITEDGKTKRVRKGRVIIKALVAKAAKGHVPAADKVLTMMIQMFGYEDQRPATRALTENENMILERMLGDEASIEDVTSANNSVVSGSASDTDDGGERGEGAPDDDEDSDEDDSLEGDSR